MKNNFGFTNRGFTLIELLVVVAIVAILALVGIFVYSSTLQSGRDAKRQSDVQSIAKALEVHYDNYNAQYPAIDPTWFITPVNATAQVPTDPIDGDNSCYLSSGNIICRYCFVTPGSPRACVSSDPATPAFSTPAPAFEICANMESNKVASSGLYCISGQR